MFTPQALRLHLIQAEPATVGWPHPKSDSFHNLLASVNTSIFVCSFGAALAALRPDYDRSMPFLVLIVGSSVLFFAISTFVLEEYCAKKPIYLHCLRVGLVLVFVGLFVLQMITIIQFTQ